MTKERDYALTAANVDRIIRDCMYQHARDVPPVGERVITEGIVNSFVLDPAKVEEHAAEIKEMLDELPPEFAEVSGGGFSFLNAPMRRDGSQWGEQPDAEALMVLGLASGWAQLILPRMMWAALPGEVPYFVVRKKQMPAPQRGKSQVPAEFPSKERDGVSAPAGD